jgi:hypothetical protein
MVRAGEAWTYDEPTLNDRGLPVIHNIAEILGCIRLSPDLPTLFPENEDGFQELERRLKETDGTPIIKPELAERKLSDDSAIADMASMDAVTSPSEDDPDEKDFNQAIWPQQVPADNQFSPAELYKSPESVFTQDQGFSPSSLPINPPQQRISQFQPYLRLPIHRQSASLNIPSSKADCNILSNSNLSSPIRTESPFTPWSTSTLASDDFLGPPSMLDITSSYIYCNRISDQTRREQRHSESLLSNPDLISDIARGSHSTVQPTSLDCASFIGMEMDGMSFDYDGPGIFDD